MVFGGPIFGFKSRLPLHSLPLISAGCRPGSRCPCLLTSRHGTPVVGVGTSSHDDQDIKIPPIGCWAAGTTLHSPTDGKDNKPMLAHERWPPLPRRARATRDVTRPRDLCYVYPVCGTVAAGEGPRGRA